MPYNTLHPVRTRQSESEVFTSDVFLTHPVRVSFLSRFLHVRKCMGVFNLCWRAFVRLRSGLSLLCSLGREGGKSLLGPHRPVVNSALPKRSSFPNFLFSKPPFLGKGEEWSSEAARLRGKGKKDPIATIQKSRAKLVCARACESEILYV